MGRIEIRVDIHICYHVLNTEEKAQEAPARTYTVVRGDSLWGIASKLLGKGSRYKEIKTLNGLKSDTITAGQVLKIPEK